ncbi:MAG: alanine racemase [Clostridia bacterium]|nr:alanine racemase [Clostridia bacterium]
METVPGRSRLRTWAEIDLGAAESNYLTAKSRFTPRTRLFAVVKADAYGHGADMIASDLCRNAGADGFAVATPQEALQLRDACPDSEIIILGYTPKEYFGDIINDGKIYPAIFTLRDAADLSAECAGGKTAGVFFAVETGMGRIGFQDTADGISEAVKSALLPGISVKGIFSHFATADSENAEGTAAQAERFGRFKKALEEKLGHSISGSLYNSAAIVSLSPEDSYDIARLGILLYGLRATEYADCSGYKPVMSLKTRVVALHDAFPGDGISYGRTFVADRRVRVATLCAGYADGYPRSLSNRGEVLIRGKRCRVIGRVCMDMMMADVSGVPDAETGDEAVLFGKSGNETVSADDIADLTGTIGHEIVCGISKRVPRVYFRNGESVRNGHPGPAEG